MAVPSAIEGHPEQHRIIEMLLAGASLRKIGSSVTPKVSHPSILRYKRSKSTEELTNFLVERNSLHNTGVAMRQTMTFNGQQGYAPVALLELHKNRLLGTLSGYTDLVGKRAPKSKTDNGLATLVNAGRGVVETEARLLGLLNDQASPTILIQAAPGANVQVNAVLPGTSEPMPELDAGTIDVQADDDVNRR